MSDLRAKLNEISKLEEEYGVLGVSFFTPKDAKITTEEGADIVKNMLQTICGIKSGEIKFTRPDFTALDSLRIL